MKCPGSSVRRSIETKVINVVCKRVCFEGLRKKHDNNNLRFKLIQGCYPFSSFFPPLKATKLVG